MSKRRYPRAEKKKWLRDRELVVDVTRLEIASGYDGLLRGAPEPVVVLAAFEIGAAPEHEVRTLFRAIHRADLVEPSFPQLALTQEQLGPTHCGLRPGARVFLLLCGIEDDGGGGVGAVFGALERADKLGVVLDGGDTLYALRELAASGAAGLAPLTLLRDGARVASLCTADDWVGAAGGLLPDGASDQRANLATADRRNDWTVLLHSRCHS